MAEGTTTTSDHAEVLTKQGEKTLWYMHISGPDDVHAVPDFWTGLAWAAELNGFIAAKATKEKWAADDNWPLTQATIRRWTGSAEQHANLLARELSEREGHAEKRAAALAAQPVDFQARVTAQILNICADDPTDVAERRDRHAEEDAELLQALGLTREAHHRIVDYVHDRPVGEPDQEMGGTVHTLAALAGLAGLDMMACAERELARVGTPEITAKIRRKRSNRHGRGPLPGDDADLITEPSNPQPAEQSHD